MNKFAALAVFVLGAVLLFAGAQRRDSLAGATEAAGQKLATQLDGEPRFATHTVYLAAGVVCVIIGGAALVRRPSA